LLTDEIERYR